MKKNIYLSLLLLAIVISGCSNQKTNPKVKEWLTIADKIAIECDSLHSEEIYGAIESKSALLQEAVSNDDILELSVGMNGIEKTGFNYSMKHIDNIDHSEYGDGFEIPSNYKDGYSYKLRSKKIYTKADSTLFNGMEYQLLNAEGKAVNYSITFRVEK